MNDNIEIMAPVGCWESLQVAIAEGANSIYFGVDKLNMRAKSSVNFTLDDMAKIVALCKQHRIKTYLTLNTVMYPEDLPTTLSIVQRAKKEGIDAIIASDIAVMQYCLQEGVEVHLSTQLNIANTEALRFYAQFADVAVLARELNLEQVKQIHDDIVREHIVGRSGKLMRLEMFCHGALCMAVSGKCYLSLHNYNQSANRGACVQICRRAYTVFDKSSGMALDIDNQYIMSPKDLKTIHFLNKILDAGVSVLKIEGRARGPEYVAKVVRCYRQAVEAYQKGEWQHDSINYKIKAWDEQLAEVFNRGFWDGYYLGQPLGEWTHTYGSQATKKKIFVGKCTNFFKQHSVAEFTVEAISQIQQDDEFMITGETTGLISFVASELRDANCQKVAVVKQGEVFSVKIPELCRRGDKLYVLQKS